MGDTCTEKLVKRETTRMERTLKAGLIATEVILILAALFLTLLAIPLLIVTEILRRVVCPQFDLEYEYLYVNGDLDVDKIIAKKKRKHVASFSVNHMEVFAPYDSHELDAFRRDKSVEVLDCSSGSGKDLCGLVVSEDGKKRMLLFEPDEAMIRDIRRIAPNKVSRNFLRTP